MIQIYSPGNTNFEQNGNMTLFPEICEASSELGGAWTLEITHPIDDEGRWKYIEREAVLSVPTFMGKNQLYRIDEITDKNDVDISAKAYPIFYDAADEVFLMDKRPTAKNGQEALDDLTEGTKYSGESNISAGNTAYFVRRNLMDCISGDDYPSFLQVWGGEPLYQNYKVIINERAGGDYGAEVRYGKNMVGVNVTEDMSEVVTRIVPVAFNGRILSTFTVDSPLIKNYAKVYTKEIKFEDVRYFEDVDEGTDTTDLIVCNSQEELDAALIAKCNEQFAAGIDLFKVTIDVDMVALENTEEYKDFEDLVKIGLGDDVSCYHTRLGIKTKTRAIKIVWDCITNSVKNVILGDYQYDFLKRFNSTMDKVEKVLNEDGSVGAQYVKGILNAMNTQLRYQKNVAQKQEVRAMLFEDLDPNSPMYGAMAYGTQGIQIANKRTTDGREWDWNTAITAHGILADAIITGILSDKSGRNFWDLDTGKLEIKDGKMYLSGKRVFRSEDYTQNDVIIAKKLRAGDVELTLGYADKYDIDGDGDISSRDVLKITKLANGDVSEFTLESFVEINPANPNRIISTNGVLVGGGGIYSKILTSEEIKGRNYVAIDDEGVEYRGMTGGYNGLRVAGGRKLDIRNGIVTNFEDGDYDVLWSGKLFMQENQSIDLAGLISAQPCGIILVFSPYDLATDTTYDYDFNSFFISNYMISEYEGKGNSFFLTTGMLGSIGNKYLYIYDNKIVGYEGNNKNGTKNGITYDNTKWVLRYVIGM